MTTFSGTAQASQCRSSTRSRSAMSSSQLSVTRRWAQGFTSASVWPASCAIRRTRCMTLQSFSCPALIRSSCAGTAEGSRRSAMGCWSAPPSASAKPLSAKSSATAAPVERRGGEAASPRARRCWRRSCQRLTKPRSFARALRSRRAWISSSLGRLKSSFSSQSPMTSFRRDISQRRRARRARYQRWSFLAAQASGSSSLSSSPSERLPKSLVIENHVASAGRTR
mmetsp:Transcript_111305/g.346979  ORF Transcript_111305/g.346979 Transcript_111305/m.346979 type:complete len:225 (-) Transcript_111305:273-947(-)